MDLIMDDVILKTERLLLRYQRKTDVSFLVDLWTDEDMTKYTGGPRNKNEMIEEFERIASEPQKEEYDLWPIELKKSHELIGYAGLTPKEIKGTDYIELNYFIAKNYWRNGYAKEIAMALIKYGFEGKGLIKLIAIINPENEPSKIVAEKVGMKYWINEVRSGKEKSIYIIENEEI